MGIHKKYQAEVFNMAKEIIIDEERGFKGVWIPKNLYMCTELTPNEKFLLLEIYSLSKKNICYAKNKHFADFTGLKENTVQKALLKFEEKGYLNRVYEYKDGTKEIKCRKLILTKKFYKELMSENSDDEVVEKNPQGDGLKVGDKYNNNKYNSINSSTELNDSDFDFEILQKANKLTDDETIIESIEYYLDKYKRFTGKNHPNVSKSALDGIICNIQSVLQDEWDDVVNEDGLERMISRHFKTDYGQAIDYNIVHFGNKKILEYQARNVGLITGWRD